MRTNRLMQLFKDNHGAERIFNVENGEDEATIYLYDAIGDWFGLGAKDFITELNDIQAGTIHLRINSPGGDVFDARAISTALKQCKAKTVAHIDGVCASAATYVALSCNEVEMADGSLFMIHKAWTLAVGNADDMMDTADLLEKIDNSIAKDYAAKTGAEVDDMIGLMAAETWLDADEAVEMGFVDRVFKSEKVDNRWNLDVYDKVPEKYKQKEESVVTGYDRDRLERRLNLAEAF